MDFYFIFRTTMGEDVNNYEEIIFDDDEDDEYDENEDEYEMEDSDNHCHHSVSNDGGVIVEHRLECGARLVRCCEKHHHVCQGDVEVNPSHHGELIENDQTVSKERNGPRARKCIEGSDGIVADNGRHNEFPSTRKPCIASSNSSSSDEFLELPFNDLSVSSGIYGAARNACYMNSNVANIASNSGSNKRR